MRATTTIAYLRFQKQIRALRKGKMTIVRKLGREAGQELAMRANTSQLSLAYLQ